MNKRLYSFSLRSQLAVDKAKICQDSLTMAGVNQELFALVKMTAPIAWARLPISKWPTQQRLFRSWLLLFGVMPIDLHHFLFTEVRDDGFREMSSSLTHAVWQHERNISTQLEGITVEDHVCYRSRLPILGGLLKPIYQAVFHHWHRRLRKRYRAI